MTLHDEYHEGKGHAGTQGLLQSVCTSCHVPCSGSRTKKGQSPTSLPEQAQTQSSPVTSQNQSYHSWPHLQQPGTGRGIYIFPWALSQDHYSFLGQAQHQEPKGSQQGTGTIGSQQRAGGWHFSPPLQCPGPYNYIHCPTAAGEWILLGRLAREAAAFCWAQPQAAAGCVCVVQLCISRWQARISHPYHAKPPA